MTQEVMSLKIEFLRLYKLMSEKSSFADSIFDFLIEVIAPKIRFLDKSYKDFNFELVNLIVKPQDTRVFGLAPETWIRALY